MDDLTMCVCGHPVSHHRTGQRNQHQSRCAYRATATAAECPCQLPREAARNSRRLAEESR